MIQISASQARFDPLRIAYGDASPWTILQPSIML